VTEEGTAIVAFATGVIAATFARSDSPLRCDVFTPEISAGEATMEMVTAGGIALEVIIRESKGAHR
jgi:hypothetical protein